MAKTEKNTNTTTKGNTTTKAAEAKAAAALAEKPDAVKATEADAAAVKKAYAAAKAAEAKAAAEKAEAAKKAAAAAAEKAEQTEADADFKSAAALAKAAKAAAALAKAAAVDAKKAAAAAKTDNMLLQKLIVEKRFSADDLKSFTVNYAHYNRMISGAFANCVIYVDEYIKIMQSSDKDKETKAAAAAEKFMRNFNVGLAYICEFCGYEKTAKAAAEKKVPCAFSVRPSAFYVFVSAASAFSKTDGFRLKAANYYKQIAILLVCDKIDNIPFAETVNGKAVERAKAAAALAEKEKKAEAEKAKAA